MNDIQKLKEGIDTSRSSLTTIIIMLLGIIFGISFESSTIKGRLNAQAKKIERLEDTLSEQTRTLDNIYRQCRQSSP